MLWNIRYLIIALLLFFLSTNIFAKVEVAFTPGDAKKHLLLLIQHAQQRIDIAIYCLTNQNITNMLTQAAQHGIKIRIILDKKSILSRYRVLSKLQHPNIKIKMAKNHAIMHHKFMIVDNETIETGSFNYTKAAATTNTENIVIITQEAQTTKRYQDEFMRLWHHSSSLLLN